MCFQFLKKSIQNTFRRNFQFRLNKYFKLFAYQMNDFENISRDFLKFEVSYFVLHFKSPEKQKWLSSSQILNSSASYFVEKQKSFLISRKEDRKNGKERKRVFKSKRNDFIIFQFFIIYLYKLHYLLLVICSLNYCSDRNRLSIYIILLAYRTTSISVFRRKKKWERHFHFNFNHSNVVYLLNYRINCIFIIISPPFLLIILK